MIKSTQEAIVIALPMVVGIVTFGTLGIYIEIIFAQGLAVANEWLFTLRVFYPEGMLSHNGYKPVGNYIGLFVGLLWGWWIAKFILAPRILGKDYSRKKGK
jgi:Na+(H+)/acetate symporter ActP